MADLGFQTQDMLPLGGSAEAASGSGVLVQYFRLVNIFLWLAIVCQD